MGWPSLMTNRKGTMSLATVSWQEVRKTEAAAHDALLQLELCTVWEYTVHGHCAPSYPCHCAASRRPFATSSLDTWRILGITIANAEGRHWHRAPSNALMVSQITMWHSSGISMQATCKGIAVQKAKTCSIHRHCALARPVWHRATM